MPLAQIKQKIRGARTGLIAFLIAAACLSMVSGIFEPTFNNYLWDTFRIPTTERGFLELPREMPGFLVAVMAGALFFVAETRVAAICAFLTMLGVALLGRAGDHWYAMLVGMTTWSIGAHLFQPLNRSIALQLSDEHAKGRRLGQVGTVGAVAGIGGSAIVFVGLRFLHFHYSTLFVIAAAVALMAVPAFLAMPVHVAQVRRTKWVFRRRYSVYYAMCFLFGARKQVFITFGPWVLIKIFHQQAYIIAMLQIISQVILIFFQPILGRLIDRIGERTILIVDGLVLIVISAAYGLLPPGSAFALYALLACYVLDQVSFSVGIARDTYLSKIAVTPEDVPPTLSLGISINHAVSMSLPWLGGAMWDKFGYGSVFLGSGVIAVLNVFASAMVRSPRRPAAPEAAALVEPAGGEPDD
jgi:MFS family permease